MSQSSNHLYKINVTLQKALFVIAPDGETARALAKGEIIARLTRGDLKLVLATSYRSSADDVIGIRDE